MNDFRTWAKGLVAAVVGGASSSLGLIVATGKFPEDPSMLWKVALFGALTHVVAYLQKSPVPGEVK